MPSILSIKNLTKTYAGGFEALKNINLDVERGEIFALLGPNGAGKTTLINIICGIVNPGTGTALVNGSDIVSEFRETRAIVGLVPQELPVDAFTTVWTTASFSRGLFGKPPNPQHIEKVLRSLSLWDKKDTRIIELSGGMKRRVFESGGAGLSRTIASPATVRLASVTHGQCRLAFAAGIGVWGDSGRKILAANHCCNSSGYAQTDPFC
jgi:ABC-type Mn2+/Zn2+ transport system ATPase subunit